MKREELKTFYKTSIYEPTEEFYCKDDADKVMDALEYDIRIYQDIVKKAEARINELEAANIKCQEHRELIERENEILTKMLNERIERVNELKDELQVANRCAEEARERIKELEQVNQCSQPKWISVKDRLPNECEAVVCLVDKWEEMSVCWIEYMYESKRWTDGDRDYPMDYYTHWMPLLQLQSNDNQMTIKQSDD